MSWASKAISTFVAGLFRLMVGFIFLPTKGGSNGSIKLVADWFKSQPFFLLDLKKSGSKIEGICHGVYYAILS